MNVTVENDVVYALTNAALTPSDSADVSEMYNQGLWIESAGDVAIEFPNGNTHTYTITSANTQLNVMVKKVLATGTTCTGIYGIKRYR